MCRTPEIAIHSTYTLTWNGHSFDCSTGYAYMGSTVELSKEQVNERHSYRCVNCDRWAYECPVCEEIRCDSDIHHTIMGSYPLACKVCHPERPKHAMGASGIYVDSERIREAMKRKWGWELQPYSVAYKPTWNIFDINDESTWPKVDGVSYWIWTSKSAGVVRERWRGDPYWFWNTVTHWQEIQIPQPPESAS